MIREIGLTLITAGVVVLLFVVYGLVGTNAAEAHNQDQLRNWDGHEGGWWAENAAIYDRILGGYHAALLDAAAAIHPSPDQEKGDFDWSSKSQQSTTSSSTYTCPKVSLVK